MAERPHLLEEAVARAPRSRPYDGGFYARLLDPLNADLHGFVSTQVEPGARVLEVGCGTGVLAFRLAHKAAEVVGVELSPAMIAYAKRRLGELDLHNVSFVLGDVATSLAGRADASFDVATMVLMLHEVPAEERARVLREVARVACRVLCVDYSVPLPRTMTGLLYRGLELAAGKEHFRSFRDFAVGGGTAGVAASAGLTCRKLRTIGGGTLDVSEVRAEGRATSGRP